MRSRRRYILFLYFTKEVLPYILLVFLILTILILTQQIGRQPELILLSKSLPTIVKILFYLLPNIVTITLPFALLLGTIVGLNRLSADSEIIAAKSTGLGLLTLATPLLMIGLTASLFSLLLTHHAVPWSLKQLKIIRTLLLRETFSYSIKPHTFSNYFPNHLIYIQQIDEGTGNWIGVFILKRDTTQTTQLFTATHGQLRIAETPTPSIEIELSHGLSIETFSSNTNQNLASFNKLTIKLSNLANSPQSSSVQESVQEMATPQLNNRMADHELPKTDILPAAIEYHKRFAIPLAALVVVIIGIIAGAQTSRHSGRTAGLALGFSVALIYYLILIAGQNLALSGAVAPVTGVWLANITCLVSAIILASTSRQLKIRDIHHYRTKPAHKSAFLPSSRTSKPRPTASRIHITNLITYIVISELIKYFAISLGSLIIISIIFTLFDLLPAIARNNIRTQYLLTYLSYLTPQLAYYLAPFALLVGILTTYNVLSRTNQITAMLAGGQSYLTLILPSLFATTLLITLLFVLSEGLLPYTNREQDYRYHYIKGRQIEQATIAFGQKWVYGLNHTIYSYQYLNHNKLLLNTTAYRLDSSEHLLRQITYAREATPSTQQTWNVSSGYQYTILNREIVITSLTPPHQINLNIPEGSSLFRRTTNEAAKMNLADLHSYLQHLTLIGAPTTDLRIELEKKKAFPFACFTLAAIAIPLALVTPRRGTLAGLGLSIGFSLTFWSITTALEAAGKRSLLPVWMAVWGSQALFLTLAAYISLRRKF